MLRAARRDRMRPSSSAGQLTRGAWVDYATGWLSGADELFLRLRETVPWRAERREMYDRTVDVPRLVCSYGAHDALPDPSLVAARDALNRRYAEELGEEFVTAGLCYYRDGRDSVAWHGDRIGRGRSENTMVAIVSLGAERRLSLRPRAGGVPQLLRSRGCPNRWGSRSATETCWSWAVPASARGTTRCSRRSSRSGRASVSSSAR